MTAPVTEQTTTSTIVPPANTLPAHLELYDQTRKLFARGNYTVGEKRALRDKWFKLRNDMRQNWDRIFASILTIVVKNRAAAIFYLMLEESNVGLANACIRAISETKLYELKDTPVLDRKARTTLAEEAQKYYNAKPGPKLDDDLALLSQAHDGGRPDQVIFDELYRRGDFARPPKNTRGGNHGVRTAADAIETGTRQPTRREVLQGQITGLEKDLAEASTKKDRAEVSRINSQLSELETELAALPLDAVTSTAPGTLVLASDNPMVHKIIEASKRPNAPQRLAKSVAQFLGGKKSAEKLVESWGKSHFVNEESAAAQPVAEVDNTPVNQPALEPESAIEDDLDLSAPEVTVDPEIAKREELLKQLDALNVRLGQHPTFTERIVKAKAINTSSDKLATLLQNWERYAILLKK